MTEPAEDPIEITLAVPAALLGRLDAVAAATARSRSEVIAEAITFVVAEHEERTAGEAAEIGPEDEPPGAPPYFSGG